VILTKNSTGPLTLNETLWATLESTLKDSTSFYKRPGYTVPLNPMDELERIRQVFHFNYTHFLHHCTEMNWQLRVGIFTTESQHNGKMGRHFNLRQNLWSTQLHVPF
jgi:hypothetical protein